MINISVDEAYAFDYLSILDIKKDINLKNKTIWENCFFNLENQLGQGLMNNIINSEEYKKLKEANKRTFDAVEKARYGDISAKEVDEENMLRYKRKLELQNKFFNNSLTEYKT